MRHPTPFLVAAVLALAAPLVPMQDPPLKTESRPVATPLGQTLPKFTFDAPDGEVAFTPGGTLRVKGRDTKPSAALLVHVFQPDCLACRHHAEALTKMAESLPPEDARVVLIAHKGTPEDVANFVKETKTSLPTVPGAASPWAKRWGRGDPMYIVDRQGRIVYYQVGYHPKDLERWKQVIEDLAAGRSPRVTGPDRLALMEGSTFPEMAFPDLATDKLTRLAVVDGRLRFSAASGAGTPGATLCFFSRY
jgi:thiol-disulfide isomerase/thioredoxin